MFVIHNDIAIDMEQVLSICVANDTVVIIRQRGCGELDEFPLDSPEDCKEFMEKAMTCLKRINESRWPGLGA